MRKITRIIIHHSESPGGNAVFLRHIHVHDNGWSDIGYHYVIGNGLPHGDWKAAGDGEIQIGRPMSIAGAHARGANFDSIGICLIGNFTRTDPTPAQIASLTNLCLEICKEHMLEPAIDIIGHCDVCSTDCPGERMRIYLPALRYILKGYLMIERLMK